MKHFLFILFFIPFVGFAQADTTITYSTFELEADRVLPSYKTTIIDSARSKTALTLAELIQNNSAVFIKSYGTGLASISFRGTGASHTQVLWNGITLNSPMNGQVDFSLYPTAFFDNVRLNYGANGLAEGNGALGGSVILNNSTNFNNHFNASVQQSIGSFNHYTTSASSNFSVNNWFSETQIYHTNQQNNYPYKNNTEVGSPIETLTNAEKTQYGFQQAIFKRIKNQTIGVRFWYYKSDRNLVAPIVSRTTKENQQDESIRGLFEWKGNYKKLHYKFVSGLVKDVINYEDISTFNSSNNKTYLSDNVLTTNIYLNKNITIKNNLNIRYEFAKSNGLSTDKKRFNNSWLLGVSQKYKRINIDALNRFLMVGNEQQLFAPNLNILVQLLKKKELYLKANTGINYHYPTFNDLFWVQGGDADLKPEKSKMAELGLLHKQPTSFFNVKTEATAFYNYVTNWIIWLPTEFGYWKPKNLQEVENKGLEASLEVSSIRSKKLKFSSSLHYTYTLSTNKKAKLNNDNSLDKQLIYVPYHKLSYYIAAEFKKTTLTYQFNYTGKRYVTSDNNWYMPANYISDVILSRKIELNKKFTLLGSFKVNNIFNQDYQSIAYRPMPGRNYLLSIVLGFKK
ncbi:MAG: TonB-dependent receptor plug domain-containing protein [Flavobacteriales bacterium]|nr:TonB-dependent receptor plug domain-containing protein [Flavobacteriales bacterium]MCB9365237.1 TonB-dependent receptor plug domain-containing protein [Flavobacteriales bacterium]